MLASRLLCRLSLRSAFRLGTGEAQRPAAHQQRKMQDLRGIGLVRDWGSDVRVGRDQSRWAVCTMMPRGSRHRVQISYYDCQIGQLCPIGFRNARAGHRGGATRPLQRYTMPRQRSGLPAHFGKRMSMAVSDHKFSVPGLLISWRSCNDSMIMHFKAGQIVARSG
jgi:hypothetical protein